MIGSIIDKKTNEFQISRVTITIAITVIIFILSSFLSVLSFINNSKQFYHL